MIIWLQLFSINKYMRSIQRNNTITFPPPTPSATMIPNAQTHTKNVSIATMTTVHLHQTVHTVNRKFNTHNRFRQRQSRQRPIKLTSTSPNKQSSKPTSLNTAWHWQTRLNWNWPLLYWKPKLPASPARRGSAPYSPSLWKPTMTLTRRSPTETLQKFSISSIIHQRPRPPTLTSSPRPNSLTMTT